MVVIGKIIAVDIIESTVIIAVDDSTLTVRMELPVYDRYVGSVVSMELARIVKGELVYSLAWGEDARFGRIGHLQYRCGFYRRWSLAQRGAVDPLPDDPVEGILLVANEDEVLRWEDNESQYGHDVCSLYPAVHNGNLSWLICETWSAAHGYCASGRHESIVSFEEGCKILLERGVFKHMWEVA